MAKIVKTIFQLRRGSTEEWLANKDVVPAAGEPCFDLDKFTLRIGDGTTTYENLPEIGGSEEITLSADGKSIILEEGIFKLAGFDAAEVGAQPRKKADGTLEWVVPSTETVDGLKASVSGLQSDVKTIQGNVKTLQDMVGQNSESAASLLDRVEGLEGKVGADTVEAQIDAKINAFAAQVTEDGKVNTLAELFGYVSEHGQEVTGMLSDISTLKELVGGKVDKVDGMGLSSNDFTDSLLGKLEAIEENAQVNIIEKISVGGSILDITDKTVDIPVANLDNVGVVKSATGANKVNIANDGVMSVNTVSVGSLVVPIGEELILDGGTAKKGTPVYPTTIGNIGYDSIADAVNYAGNGDVITLQEDIAMGTADNDHLVVSAENVTIDLGGKTLTANGSNGAIKVEGGMTTLDGAGTVSGTLGSDNYSMAVWASSGTVVINDGIYRNETDNSARGTDLIYASGTGCIEINGGVFEAAKPEWTLNVKDADYKAGTAKIIVKGGSFKGFDPANNASEGAGTSFVAEGYKSVLEGEYYVVKPM